MRDAVDPDVKEGMHTVVDLCYARENLLCLLEIFCLMPRTKFGSDTMLNINIINSAMCYTMLCMLEWMRKRKHRIGTENTRVTWFSLDGLYPQRNPLRATSLLCVRV